MKKEKRKYYEVVLLSSDPRCHDEDVQYEGYSLVEAMERFNYEVGYGAYVELREYEAEKDVELMDDVELCAMYSSYNVLYSHEPIKGGRKNV